MKGYLGLGLGHGRFEGISMVKVARDVEALSYYVALKSDLKKEYVVILAEQLLLRVKCDGCHVKNCPLTEVKDNGGVDLMDLAVSLRLDVFWPLYPALAQVKRIREKADKTSANSMETGWSGADYGDLGELVAGMRVLDAFAEVLGKAVNEGTMRGMERTGSMR